MLEDKIKDLPEKPGVYIMKNAQGEIIYVGKAVVLKNRVRQYFNNSPKQIKVQTMVDNIADFEYIITLSEKDALALENNLIKKYKPHYNILLKDDKTSPYIKVKLKDDFPVFTVTRRVRRDGARYFGPYVSIPVKEILSILQGAYRVRTCVNPFRKGMRECLNYHIGLCSAPCTGRIDKQEYAQSIRSAMSFLSGHDDTVEDVIERKMIDSAENERFESAIMYRKQLEVLRALKTRVVTELTTACDIDAIAQVSNGLYNAVSVVIVRGGKIMGVKNYVINDIEVFDQGAFENFITQYYALSGIVPDEICLQGEFDVGALGEYFASVYAKTPEFTFPKKGAKARLIDTAMQNAYDYLEKRGDRETRRKEMTLGAAERLAQVLKIPSCRRMECYDISNISGVDKVASEAVFINGDRAPDQYRRFKIRTVEGSDDFASMKETLTRRLTHLKEGEKGFDEKPDLIVIDGGKGQLSSALEAMQEVGIYVNMVSLAKRDEELYVPSSPNPIVLTKDDYALRLCQRIRDEAHRFAITYHRTLRSRRYESELVSIDGVGAQTAKKVLAAFTTSAIKAATQDEIKLKAGISDKVAKNIYNYYHQGEEE